MSSSSSSSSSSTSDRRLAANRANAALSTGPRTQDGKAASSRNAVSHGLTASELTIFNWESPEKYATLRDDYYTRFSPIATAESDVIDRLIDSTWRRRRALVIETTLFDLEISDTRETTEYKYGETACGPLHLAMAFKNRHGEGVWDAILRLINAVDRGYSRALRDLQKLQGDRFNILPQRPEEEEEVEVDKAEPATGENAAIPTGSEHQRQEQEGQQHRHPAATASSVSTHNKIFEIVKRSQSEPAAKEDEAPATAENRKNEPIRITTTTSSTRTPEETTDAVDRDPQQQQSGK